RRRLSPGPRSGRIGDVRAARGLRGRRGPGTCATVTALPPAQGLMNLTGLLPPLLTDASIAEAVALARENPVARAEQVDVVAPVGVRPPLLAALAEGTETVVVVTATGRDGDELASALRCYLPHDDVAVLPSWETLPHERLSPRSDTVARRLAVFRRLAHPSPEPGRSGPVRVLVVPVRALLQPVVEGLGDLVPVAVSVGDVVDLDDV